MPTITSAPVALAKVLVAPPAVAQPVSGLFVGPANLLTMWISRFVPPEINTSRIDSSPPAASAAASAASLIALTIKSIVVMWSTANVTSTIACASMVPLTVSAASRSPLSTSFCTRWRPASKAPEIVSVCLRLVPVAPSESLRNAPAVSPPAPVAVRTKTGSVVATVCSVSTLTRPRLSTGTAAFGLYLRSPVVSSMIGTSGSATVTPTNSSAKLAGTSTPELLALTARPKAMLPAPTLGFESTSAGELSCAWPKKPVLGSVKVA